MTRTTNYIAGIVLVVAFLTAAQVRADLMTHTFAFRSLQNTTYKDDAWKDVTDALSLTATDNGKGGIDFMLSSSWTGNNGGPGILMGYGYNYLKEAPAGYDMSNEHYLYKNYVSLNNHDGLFTNKLITSTNGSYAGGRLETLGFQREEGSNVSFDLFTLKYKEGNTWSDFLDLFVADNPLTAENEAENGFYLSVTLGELDGSRSNTSFASFDTALAADVVMSETVNATPEPATLAVLGLGLAGLGLVCRRRRK